MNVKKLEKKIISKDRIFFVVLFVVTAITLGFLSAVETVTVSDFKNDISPDLAIFNNNLGSIDPTKLQTQKNSLSNIWLNEEVFLYLEFTHLDLYLNDSNLISEEMVGLFSSNTTGLINYLIESQVAFIEGNIPVGEDEVLVDRDTYYKLLYQNNKSDLLNSPFPLNFHFGVAQKKNITLEIKITGIIEFDLNSPIIKSLFGYYYSYPIDINLRSSVEFALNRFSNYFILGNFEMGESLFTEFHNLDIYHYILTRFCVYDNKFHSNINSAIENQSIEKTLSYLNQENGEFWALSGGSLDIFLTKSSLINDWFILILFAGFIFVMFLMIFYKFYYDKSLRENYSRELDSLINIGLPVKKIMILYLYDRIKRLNASILFSFAASLLFKFLFVIFFNLPSVLSVYYINFQIFIIIFIIYNAIFIPIEYFRVKKGINTILPKKKHLYKFDKAVRNGRNRSS